MNTSIKYFQNFHGSILECISDTEIHAPVKATNRRHFVLRGFAEEGAVTRSEINTDGHGGFEIRKLKANDAVGAGFARIVKYVHGTTDWNGERQWIGVSPSAEMPVPTLNIAVNDLTPQFPIVAEGKTSANKKGRVLAHVKLIHEICIPLKSVCGEVRIVDWNVVEFETQVGADGKMVCNQGLVRNAVERTQGYAQTVSVRFLCIDKNTKS